MKYTLRNLLIAVTACGIVASTLRVPSPPSVVVLLLSVFGLLVWSAATAFLSSGIGRRIHGTAAVAGFAYLTCYVATDTPIEAWINALSIAPFALMKDGLITTLPTAELTQWSNSMEFHFFQQKVHLMLALVFAVVAGWLANT